MPDRQEAENRIFFADDDESEALKYVTHKFSIEGQDCYLTPGFDSHGAVREINIVLARTGSFVSGLAGAVAVMMTTALQHDVPLQVLVDKIQGMRFEPAGRTSNPDIPIARSVMDYIGRWLELKFLISSLEQGDDRA